MARLISPIGSEGRPSLQGRSPLLADVGTLGLVEAIGAQKQPTNVSPRITVHRPEFIGYKEHNSQTDGVFTDPIDPRTFDISYLVVP